MTKHSFRSIIKSFTFLAFITLLTSCEGFFTNNGVDEKIRAAIDYANTPFSTFVVSADSNAGTIIPSGQVQYKPTDLQNIEFTCNPTYEFLGWDFSYKQTAQAADTPTLTAADKDWWKDYISIVKEKSEESLRNGQIVYTYTLQIQFIKAAENLLIKPICSKKPLVESIFPDAPTPARSISRDSQVNITFDSVLDPETIKDSITIKNDGIDCTNFFDTPELINSGEGSNRKSIIVLSPVETLDCPEGGTAKITIELSNKIKTIDGVALTSQTLFYYIDDSTSVYCFVDLGGSYEGGSLSPNSSPFQYGINKNQLLTFNENSNYKFLHWLSNNDKIIFAEEIYSNPIHFRSIEEVALSEGAKIIPEYTKRPVFNKPIYSVPNVTVQPRDTDIKLIFDNVPTGATLWIPDDAVFAIECAGKGSVITSFEKPLVDSNNKNQINIVAKKDSSRIQVTEETNVYITIPDSIYYVYHDDVTGKDVHVTLGKSVQVSYSINNTTQNKANVTYSRKNGENVVGNLFIDNAKMTAEESAEAVQYNIDKTVSLKFEQNSDYEFLYWDITGDNDSIEIEDKFSTQTSFTVKGAGSVSIYPKCEPKLTATLAIPDEFKKDSNYFSDSDIWIETNIAPQAFDPNNQNGNSYNSITVTFNNTNVTSNYKAPVVVTENGKKYIKLESLRKLPVPAGSSAMAVSVRIDGTLYYNSNDTVINTYLGSDKKIYIKDNGVTLTFNVVEDTENKVFVKIISTDGVTIDTTAFDRYKTESWSETNKLYEINEASDFELLSSSQDNYQFIDWTIKTAAGGVVNNSISKIDTTTRYGVKIYTLNVLKRTENEAGSTSENPIIITAVCKPKLTATMTPVYGEPVPRDSNIVLTFNEVPDLSIKDKIKIFCDGTSANKYFDIAGAVLDENTKTLTIASLAFNLIPVNPDTTRTITVQIPDTSFYTYNLNGESHQIKCNDDIEYEYIIDEATTKKAKITFVVYDDSDNICNNGGNIYWNSVNLVTKNTVIPFNIDAVKKDIIFVASDDYKFKNWVVTNSNTNSINFGQTNNSISDFTLADEDENIVIKAIVEKRYRVAEFTPADTEGGVPCDSSIKMKFNWDVNTRWVWNNPLDGINIKLGNTSIMDCFNTEQVYYDRENLTLEIKSKYDGSFNKYFTSSYLTVTVTIGAPLVDIPEEHTYLINRETEKNPPKLEEVYVFKDSESSETCILSDYVNYATGTDAVENIKKNIVNRLYIGACAWDEESGLKSFIIKEQLIRSVEGNEITNSEIYTTTAINFYSGTTYADIDEWLCGDNFYEFKSLQDGVVRIELILEDLFGNTTSQSFEVIKDSIITPIELIGVGSLQPYSGGTYTYKYDQSPVEFDNSKNYKNIVLARYTVKDIVATTMDGTQLYKANTEIDDNKIGSILIDDVYVKRGINGAYVKASDCGTNVTDNINTFISGNEDFYSTSISKIYNIPQRCCVMFIEPSMDEDIYVKYKTKDSFGNEEDCSFVIPHIIRVDSSIYLSSMGNYATAEISVSESGSTETPVYVYYRTGPSSDWTKSYVTPSPLDSGNTVKLMTSKNNVNQDFSNVQFVAVTEFNRFYKSEDVFVHQNYTSTNTSFTGDVPYVDYYETKPGPINSGYHQVNVYFDPENYVDSSYSYSLLLDSSFSGNTLSEGKKYDIPKITDGSLTHLGNVSFKVASEHKYEMQMAIIDSNNKIVYHGTDESVNDYWEVNCSYDNIKPMIRNFGSTAYDAKSNGYLSFNTITENNPLEYNGQAFFYYALTDTKLSENNFGNEESKRMCWYKPGWNIRIPFYNKNANYLCVQLIDANGNTNYYTKAFGNTTNFSYDESSQISIKNIIKNDDDSYTITVNNPQGVTCKLYRSNSSADDWSELSTMTYDSENKVSTYTINYMNDNCCYIKPFSSRFYTGPQLYFYPKGYTQEIICNKKSVYDINGIMTILCDQPTLVHTLISQKNYGSDIDKWELYGGILNEKQVHSTTSYPAADDITINEGDYYIVVAYFSDGTRLTSKVHQK